MSGTQTHGFDVIYGISLDRFQRALENLFTNDLPLRPAHVDISFPLPLSLSSISQNGFFSLPDRPTATLTRTGANAFTLALAYTRSTLSLNPVPGSISSPLGVAGLGGLAPSNAGATTLTLPLTINAATSGSHSPITIALASDPTLSPPSLLSSLPIAVPAVGGVTLANMRAAVLAAVLAAVVDAVRSSFPIVKDVALPTTGPCSIFPRNLSLKFLDPDSSHDPSLTFMLTLLGTSSGDFGGTTTSLLPAGNEGVLVISNNLLIELLCCLIPQSAALSGLSGIAPTRTTTPNVCCRWNNVPNLSIGGESLEAPRFEVCIVNGGIQVSGDLAKHGTGWWVTANFSLTVTLRRTGNSITPVSGAPALHVDSGVEWWVWLIAVLVVIVLAVIGFFIGGPLGSALIGAGVGFLIGALISGAVLLAIYSVASLAGTVIEGAVGALTGELEALQLLPNDLTDIFGTLDLVGDPVVDDMSVRGHVVLPNNYPSRAESADQVINRDEAIDLDRGIVQPLGSTFDPDFDLSWQAHPLVASSNATAIARTTARTSKSPAASAAASAAASLVNDLGSVVFQYPPDITTRGSARLVLLAGRSFFGLTESDLAELVYPANHGGIVNSLVPQSDSSNPPSTVVFAVRTSEGRYAKCAAWQDSRGRLHLRYRTYDTPLPLSLSAIWTSTRGAVVGTSVSAFAVVTEYEVARRGTLRATLQTTHTPVVYRWMWNGSAISGTGTLAGTTAQYTVAGAVCTIQTQMGQPLAGEICVTASDATAFEATVCRQLNLSGTERQSERSPLLDQLTHMAELNQFVVQNKPGPDPDPGAMFTLPSSLAADTSPAAQETFNAQFTRALSVGMKVSESKLKLR
jgi:hypothetical protein